MTTHKWRNRT